MLPPPCFTVGMVPGFLQTLRLSFRPKSSIIRAENLVSHGLRVIRCLLANSKRAVMCLFVEECLLSSQSTTKAWLVECCRDGCPSERFFHLHRGTLELCQSYYHFGWVASSRKNLGGSKLPPFKNDGGHCVLGDLQCCRHFLVPFSRSVPPHNPVSEVYRQFLQTHGLVFALTCTVNCGTLSRQVCTFPNHVQ